MTSMNSDVADRATFTGVYVFRRNLVYVRGSIVSLDKDQIDNSFILRRSDDAWGQYMIPAVVPSHCVIAENQRTVLALTSDGRVHVATPQGFEWERIDASRDGPNNLRRMTCIRPIGPFVYAAGMAFMVYRRDGPKTWIRFDAGLRGRLPVGGFLSIDGFDEKSIYAVGFQGEIWYFDGTEWTRVASPTNSKLECVRVLAPDLVYACGASGVIVKGSRDQWDVISQTETDLTLWSLEHFLGNIYVADHSSIFRVLDPGLERVDIGLKKPITTRHLHANDGVLWSVGDKDMVFFDGTRWREVAPP